MPAPAGLSRRELYVDARDLQSDSDPDNPMTEEEYTAVLTARGLSKMAEHQLVKSFSAVIRTVDSTYVLGEDFFLGDTITVTDERLGITADAVAYSVQQAVSGDSEHTEITLGYAQPTPYDILKRKADK